MPARVPRGGPRTAMPAFRPSAASGPAPGWPSPFPAGVAFHHATEADAARFALLPAERALLAERAAPRRVLEFTLGRGCAHAALAALVPQRAAELAALPIGREDARRPRWPDSIVGAITHHRGQAAAAVAHAADFRGLGVDLEALRTPSAGLLRRILRPEERACLEHLPPAARDEAFMVVFSAKESVFKALYPHTGIYLGFQDATVEPAPDAAGGAEDGFRALALRWRLQRACGPRYPAGAGGVGRALCRDGLVLTGVWVPAQ